MLFLRLAAGAPELEDEELDELETLLEDSDDELTLETLLDEADGAAGVGTGGAGSGVGSASGAGGVGASSLA